MVCSSRIKRPLAVEPWWVDLEPWHFLTLRVCGSGSVEVVLEPTVPQSGHLSAQLPCAELTGPSLSFLGAGPI